MSKLSIKKSSFYKTSPRDVKDIILDDDVIGYMYSVSSHEQWREGIFHAVGRDATADLLKLSNQMDKIAIEIGGGLYANKLYKEVSSQQFFHYGIVNIFDSSKEARKYARENVGCRISLHNTLLSNLLTEIRVKADRLNERNIEEAIERYKKEGEGKRGGAWVGGFWLL